MTLKRLRIEEQSVEKLAMANCVDIMMRNESLGRPKLFECKLCKKQFESFQALGGHSTSHKDRKNKVIANMSTDGDSLPNNSKKHKCSLCGKEFAIGQALGGHMRKHRDELSQLEQKKNKLKDGESSKALEDKKDLDCNTRILSLDLNLTPCENELSEEIIPF